MPRKRVGLKDVAALAGTSVATVSRVLNETGYASAEIRDKVLKAADELQYLPNLRARGLRQRSSDTIGLIIPNLLNAYYTALADAASVLVAESGYRLLLSSTRDDADTERGILLEMIGVDVAGLIWVPTAPTEHLLDYLQSRHIPAVSIVRRIPGDRIDTVVFEDFNGSVAATKHLIGLGHRRIGYIGGDVRHSSNRARWQGHLAALNGAGIEADETLIKLGGTSSTWGEIATLDLLHDECPPTAIFAASNAIVPGVVRVLRQHDVCTPDEMSLICFDDIDWFAFSSPPITAISIQRTQLAETAVGLLLRRIEDADGMSKPPVFLEVDFDMVLRSSTAPPRKKPLTRRGGLDAVPQQRVGENVAGTDSRSSQSVVDPEP